MNEFTPRKAKFQMTPNLAFCGKSGSGKTYSALLFARGYVGNNGKICVIDTENARSETYANDPLIGEFDIIDLTAPFTPDRYIQAYHVACDLVGKDGYVIIDSGSHEWEGDGGTIEFAESQTDKYGKPLKSAGKWNKPKQLRKKFVHTIATPPVATTICFRIKDKLIDAQDPSKGTVEEIVTEKNFKFELTTIISFEPETHKTKFLKAPKPLHDIAKNGVLVTKEMGAEYRKRMSGIVEPEKPLHELLAEINACESEKKLTELYVKNSNHSNKDKIIAACKVRKGEINTPKQEPEIETEAVPEYVKPQYDIETGEVIETD